MNRRQWLGSGLAAAALLVGAGAAYEWSPDPVPADSHRFRFLHDADRAVLAAIGPVMLAGSLPVDDRSRNLFIEGFDTAVSGLTPSVQAEVAQLFMLLRVPALRMIATGVMKPWHLASDDDIRRFLDTWRYSPIVKLRSAYDALHQLCYAAWYANPVAWIGTSYPGPPKV